MVPLRTSQVPQLHVNILPEDTGNRPLKLALMETKPAMVLVAMLNNGDLEPPPFLTSFRCKRTERLTHEADVKR